MAAQTGTDKASVKKLSSYFKGVKGELKKVNWPNRKELVNFTIVVLITCGLVSLIVWLLDIGFNRLLSLIVR